MKELFHSAVGTIRAAKGTISVTIPDFFVRPTNCTTILSTFPSVQRASNFPGSIRVLHVYNGWIKFLLPFILPLGTETINCHVAFLLILRE